MFWGNDGKKGQNIKEMLKTLGFLRIDFTYFCRSIMEGLRVFEFSVFQWGVTSLQLQ